MKELNVKTPLSFNEVYDVYEALHTFALSFVREVEDEVAEVARKMREILVAIVGY